jgi:hypothetical protein
MRGAILAGALALGASAHAEKVRIFYDTIENGQLTGGQIIVDLSDPAQRAEFGADLTAMAPAGIWPVTTIHANGPIENRVDLVLVGDGYAAINMTRYANHVTGIVGPFFSQQPLAAYAGYFNVHRVDVLSNESGVDELDLGIYRDTALDMGFGCFGVSRALCVNASKAVAAAASAPDVDQILAVANSTRYGGAGYASYDLGTVSGDNAASLEIALHEFGHALAALADEYDYGNPAPYTGSDPTQPNISIYTASQQLALAAKWYRWLDLPHVDAFEGAGSREIGLYRPTFDSKMRTLGRPFEEVNSEQLIMSIYRIVSPVDEATPVEGGPRFGCDALYVVPQRPADHDLTIRWLVNGMTIPGATQPVLVPAQVLLAPGTYTISVVVVDETPRVRDETFRNTYMTFTRSWLVDSFVSAVNCQCTSACGDLVRDRSINLADFAAFTQCFAGHAYTTAGCICADLNGDLRIDLADLAILNGLMGRSPRFAYPQCGGP